VNELSLPLLLMLLAQAADVASTVYALKRGAKETNRWTRWLLGRFDTLTACVLFKVPLLVLVLFVAIPGWLLMLIAASLFYVAYRNVEVGRRQKQYAAADPE
jgi:hypothetical protein